jgi:hypothetical protein
MRNTWKSILGAALLVTGATQSKAQPTVLNIVQDVNFKLTGYYQMSPTENSSTIFRHAGKISITNKDIINLIENELNIIFSSDAKLLLISATPVDLTPKVVIRDKFEGERFDTDVTQYFSAEVLASIEETKINKNPLKTSGTSYDVLAFELKLTQVHFRIQGLGITQVKTGKYEGDPVAVVHTGKVDTTGSGEYQVNYLTGVVPVALFGTVQISGTDVKAMSE